MEIREAIRANLNALLESSGYKRSELADAIGAKRSAVTNWCNGTNIMSIEYVPGICRFFGVTIDEFLNHEDTRVLVPRRIALSPGEHQVLASYNAMDDDARADYADIGRVLAKNHPAGAVGGSTKPDIAESG